MSLHAFEGLTKFYARRPGRLWISAQKGGHHNCDGLSIGRSQQKKPTSAIDGGRGMTSTAIDSIVFRETFSTEAMRRVFSDENRIQKYLDIEAALAEVQARLGIIPKEAAEEICRHCHAAEIDFAKLKTQTE